MDTNLDVLGIIKRAKQVLNLKRDSELAEYLEVSRATVTNWGARNSIDFRLRRGGLRQRRQHVSHTEIGRYYRIQGN